MIDSRIGCSTISFRHLDLHTALDTIAHLGFTEVDLGSLPGVCTHVPTSLTASDVPAVVAAVAESGLAVRSINCDVGDLNDPRVDVASSVHLARLIDLAAELGAGALVLPNGAIAHRPIDTLEVDLDRVAANLSIASERSARLGVATWTESLHVYRLCCNLERAQALTSRLDPSIGIVMDFSHIVASGADPVDFVDVFSGRVTHVHVRDATAGSVDLDGAVVTDEAGNINLSVGRGDVDFESGIDALHASGYTGHYTLELETRDVTDAERPTATAAAAQSITALLGQSTSNNHKETNR